MREEVRQLAREIKDVPNAEPGLGLRQATVQAVVAGPPATVTVRFAGSTLDITGVRYLGSYAPTAGDVIWILQSGSDLLGIGKLA